MQVPDVDLVLHTSDNPCVVSWAGRAGGAPAPPIFGYTTSEGFQDIPFPDFSFWGHEHGRMRGEARRLHRGRPLRSDWRFGQSIGKTDRVANRIDGERALRTALHSGVAITAGGRKLRPFRVSSGLFLLN